MLQQITAQAQPSETLQAQTYRLLPAEADPKGAQAGAGAALGAVAVNADILQPEDGASVAAGAVEVSGYAFAGDDRRIVRVDTSTDGGRNWTHLGPWAWRRWRTRVTLAAGPAEIVARAWDSLRRHPT
jgi:sulfite oxidase